MARPLLATPTAVTLAALPTATPEPVAPTSPQGKSTSLINVRSGPGTEFGTVAALNPDGQSTSSARIRQATGGR